MADYQIYYASYKLLSDDAKMIIRRIGAEWYHRMRAELVTPDNMTKIHEQTFLSLEEARMAMESHKTKYDATYELQRVNFLPVVIEEASCGRLIIAIGIYNPHCALWSAIAKQPKWEMLRAVCQAIVANERFLNLVKVADELLKN